MESGPQSSAFLRMTSDFQTKIDELTLNKNVSISTLHYFSLVLLSLASCLSLSLQSLIFLKSFFFPEGSLKVNPKWWKQQVVVKCFRIIYINVYFSQFIINCNKWWPKYPFSDLSVSEKLSGQCRWSVMKTWMRYFCNLDSCGSRLQEEKLAYFKEYDLHTFSNEKSFFFISTVSKKICPSLAEV